MKMLSILFLCFFEIITVIDGSFGKTGSWGYDATNGPDKWKGVCQDNLRQSPIDIRAPDVDYTLLDRLQFLHYDLEGTIIFKNTGRTLSAEGFDKWNQKQPTIQGGGLKHKYKLIQFHLHWGQHDAVGSEHAVGSLHYPAELHLVHVRDGLTINEAVKHPDGIAVVGVFLAKTRKNPTANGFTPLSEKLPNVQFYGNMTKITRFRTNFMLPLDTDSFYRYEGSLTTPGCNEAVVWTILAEPIAISKHQLHLLRQVQNKEGVNSDKNYRPLQQLNGRRIQYRPSKLDRSLICSSSEYSSIFIGLYLFINALFVLDFTI